MSYLLEVLGRGLLSELAAAFRPLLRDDGRTPTEELRARARAHPTNLSIQEQLAIRCLADHDYVQARNQFRICVKLNERDLTGRAGLACALDVLGDTAGVIAQLQAARACHGTDKSLLFALGFALEKTGELDQAVECYQTALEHAPDLRNAHERLAAIHVKREDFESAIDHYEQLCFGDPGDVSLSLTLANLYLKVGLADEAIRRFQFALTVEPDNWEAQDDLAATYEQAGLCKEAIEQLEALVRTQPFFADNHLRLGDLYAKVGDDRRALDHYLKATHINPAYLEATIKVGTTHLRNGDYLQAAQWFTRAVEINDRLLVGYVGLAVAQHESGDAVEARRSLELAARAEPNSTLLFSETARLQLKVAANRQVEARLSSRGLAGGSPEPTGPVGDLIERQIERHRQALRERPNHADLHYRLGLLLRYRNRNDEAIECFRAALAINPHYLDALLKLGLSLNEAGEPEAAADTLQRALEVDPHAADLHYALGLVFADRQQFALAVEQFENALATDPKNIDFQANLALALQNMGLIDRAAASWQTLCDVLPETPIGRVILDEVSRRQA